LNLLKTGNGESGIEERRHFAAEAFKITSHYDTIIFNYFNRKENLPAFRESLNEYTFLRYGENPHQKGIYFGNLESVFEKYHGKEISYNNLLDIDSALSLIDDFSETTFAVIKHNNACGIASRENTYDAWKDALACDPVSAFGGIIVTNVTIGDIVASEIDKIFFEIIIAPAYSEKALEILKQKKNRIILRRKAQIKTVSQFRSVINGVLWQEKDNIRESEPEMKPVTIRGPGKEELRDLIFANILVKHSKSNAIVLVKKQQLCASGIGQTSRVDALRQAIEKARSFGFDLNGSVMASDAFFPFPDCVEIAHKAGITAIAEPGGSVKDKESIDYCSKNNVALVFTGFRHFKH